LTSDALAVWNEKPCCRRGASEAQSRAPGHEGSGALCGETKGSARWTLKLLCDQLLGLGLVELSYRQPTRPAARA